MIMDSGGFNLDDLIQVEPNVDWQSATDEESDTEEIDELSDAQTPTTQIEKSTEPLSQYSAQEINARDAEAYVQHLKQSGRGSQIPAKDDPNYQRTITKISAQKRKGRYNVYLGGEYAFPIAEALLVKHLLRKGMLISEEFQKQLEVEDNFAKAYTRALNYLSYKMRTEQEIRDDLAEHEFLAQADAVVDKLKEQNLINDLEYAKSYVRTAARVNRKGPRVIAQDLTERGVDDQSIQVAQVEYDLSEQVENACALIKKRMKKRNKTSERQRMQKLNNYLFKKGYTNEVINLAFDEMEPEVDEDEEYDALVKQGEKALRRYSRKTQGYELHQKTKAFLYSKGFKRELIERFMTEKVDD